MQTLCEFHLRWGRRRLRAIKSVALHELIPLDDWTSLESRHRWIGVRRLHLPLFPINAALTNLVHGHQNQSRKGDDDQSNSSKAVQLLNLAVQILSHILIEKREAHEDEEKMGAEDT